MKKIFYACDLCEREVGGEESLYDSKVGEVCAGCSAKVIKIYSKAVEELERRHGLVVENKLALASLLERLDKELWQKMYGTNGIEIVEKFLADLAQNSK